MVEKKRSMVLEQNYIFQPIFFAFLRSCSTRLPIFSLRFRVFRSIPWQFLYRNATIRGLALWPLLLCHNSGDFFKAFIVQFEAFSIIIELSHNFLWEISQLFCFDKARSGIGAFLYKNSSNHEPFFPYLYCSCLKRSTR